MHSALSMFFKDENHYSSSEYMGDFFENYFKNIILHNNAENIKQFSTALSQK